MGLRRRALKIQELLHGENHPAVALYRNSLATDLETTGCVAEALALHRRALEIDQAHSEIKDPGVQTDLGTTAALLYQRGRTAEALDLVQWTLPAAEFDASVKRRFWRSSRKLFMRPTAQTLKARVLFDLNRMDEAEVILQEVLELSSESFGPESVPVAEYLGSRAELLRATNRLGEAEEVIRRALAIDRGQASTNPLRIAWDLDHHGIVLVATNFLGEAEARLREALLLYPGESLRMGRLAPGTTAALERYERLLKNLGQPEESVRVRLAELLQGLPPQWPPLPSARRRTDSLTARPRRSTGPPKPTLGRDSHITHINDRVDPYEDDRGDCRGSVLADAGGRPARGDDAPGAH